MKINKISPLSHNYLQILEAVAKCPVELYVMGTLPEQRQVSVAIVGTRKPSAYGKEVTHQLASALAKRGVVIISGLALGVDGLAHTAALEAGGTTIAVLGNGLPRIYPAAHQQLAQRIVNEGGAIISEYEPDSAARGFQFLERNRLVSGLADAVVITEAAGRSGTLNTAAHALEQGKDVFVVPGNITSPLSAGCNALLKQGALPATSPDDILEVIAPWLLSRPEAPPLGQNASESVIIALLSEGVRDGDQLQQRSNLQPSDLSQSLTMLEIAGTVRSLGGNQWTFR